MIFWLKIILKILCRTEIWDYNMNENTRLCEIPLKDHDAISVSLLNSQYFAENPIKIGHFVPEI